jgi:hypothetical protein
MKNDDGEDDGDRGRALIHQALHNLSKIERTQNHGHVRGIAHRKVHSPRPDCSPR